MLLPMCTFKKKKKKFKKKSKKKKKKKKKKKRVGEFVLSFNLVKVQH